MHCDCLVAVPLWTSHKLANTSNKIQLQVYNVGGQSV